MLRSRVTLDEFSHSICQVMLVDFPDMRLLPAVFVSEIAERYHLVVDVVKLAIEVVVPRHSIVGINDLNPTAVFLYHVGDVIE